MAEFQYQRLTRERAPRRIAVVALTRSSLWLGADHLLLVECTGYTETYKRFYFRDIQAITLLQTKRYYWWNWIAGIFTSAFLIFILALAPKSWPSHWSSDEIAGGIALGCIAGLCALLFFINLFFGPSCRCYLRSAVQTEELTTLCRVRQAHRVFDKIRPFIVAAQGQLTPAEVAARMQEAAPAEAQTKPAEPPVVGPLPPVIS